MGSAIASTAIVACGQEVFVASVESDGASDVPSPGTESSASPEGQALVSCEGSWGPAQEIYRSEVNEELTTIGLSADERTMVFVRSRFFDSGVEATLEIVNRMDRDAAFSDAQTLFAAPDVCPEGADKYVANGISDDGSRVVFGCGTTMMEARLDGALSPRESIRELFRYGESETFAFDGDSSSFLATPAAWRGFGPVVVPSAFVSYQLGTDLEYEVGSVPAVLPDGYANFSAPALSSDRRRVMLAASQRMSNDPDRTVLVEGRRATLTTNSGEPAAFQDFREVDLAVARDLLGGAELSQDCRRLYMATQLRSPGERNTSSVVVFERLPGT
ncbi:MAG: hypothetical protein AAGA56_15180 [Myxococcota bacterium]